ncbi:MAG TPA: hypothetical protein VFZ85_03225 [Jiangellaceae bacterium]
MASNLDPTPPEARERATRDRQWLRALAYSGVATAILIGASWSWVAADEDPPYAQGSGAYVIRMSDYAFEPSDMEWRVGERVSLTFINDTVARPGRRHEFMMGRNPSHEETPFGTHYTGGFEEDFFAGLSVELSNSEAVSMVMPSESELTGPDAGGPFVMEDMAMDEMDMGGEGAMDDEAMDDEAMGQDDEHATNQDPMDGDAMEGDAMDMDGDHAEEGDAHTEEGDAHADEVMQDIGGPEGGHADDHGFMIELDPTGATTISFVVPDKPGTWEYGCFAETGQHYANGMRGTVTIVQ